MLSSTQLGQGALYMNGLIPSYICAAGTFELSGAIPNFLQFTKTFILGSFLKETPFLDRQKNSMKNYQFLPFT